MRWRRNWFSNFLPFDKPFVYLGISYPTVEHYYQAMKTLDKKDRKRISLCSTPGQAKKLGNQVHLRKFWDSHKLAYMETALKYKFNEGTTWHKKLIESSGDLIEWNCWHDNYWGNCYCPKCISIRGQNYLGIILMKLRSQLKRKLRSQLKRRK